MIRILVRGGGDLASGTAVRLARAGFFVLVTELAQPLAVRRKVSFAQAIYDGEIEIEGICGVKVSPDNSAVARINNGTVGVCVDPEMTALNWFEPDVIVDGRMKKVFEPCPIGSGPFVIGLGPGFVVGSNCHVAVETQRGFRLGRVLYLGSAEPDTGVPEQVGIYREERVIRAPGDGVFTARAVIGDKIQKRQLLGSIADLEILAPFDGVVRGLIQSGLRVTANCKIGDLDPRMDASLCYEISDKALSVGGGVVEAILSRPELRRKAFSE